MVCEVSGLEKEMAALLVKLSAPLPDEFSLVVADGPSVNWRSVLPPVPIYCSVPPFNTRLLATEPDAPIELFDPPLSRQDRKSTRLNSVTNAHLVCRLLLEKKKTKELTHHTLTLTLL